jgi:hypothetical protein
LVWGLGFKRVLTKTLSDELNGKNDTKKVLSAVVLGQIDVVMLG